MIFPATLSLVTAAVAVLPRVIQGGSLLGPPLSKAEANRARLLIQNSGLTPFHPNTHGGDRPAPRGTFRGDLLNTQNPTANYVHPPGSNTPKSHAQNPHYNLHFWNGMKSAIIIK